DHPVLQIASTDQVFEPDVPNELEGAASLLTDPAARARDMWNRLKKNVSTRRHVMRIRRFPGQGNFSGLSFSEMALQIYIEAHTLLQLLSLQPTQRATPYFHTYTRTYTPDSCPSQLPSR